MVKYINVTPALCTACGICAMTCSLEKLGKFNKYATGLWIDYDQKSGAKVHTICRQCRNPLCVKTCPAQRAWRGPGAFEPPIYRDAETGVVYLDTGKESCLGCDECMRACPFGAIRIVPENGKLVKCDQCGGDPECVKICPTNALKFLDITNKKATAHQGKHQAGGEGSGDKQEKKGANPPNTQLVFGG